MLQRASLTAAEFERIADSLGPAELIRGEVVALSPAGFEHSRIVVRVAMLLELWARRAKKGRVLAGEASSVVENKPDTVRGADVAYISYERVPRDQGPRGFLRVPPELVVEVRGERQGWVELREKATQYLAFGVDRVWIIDPEFRQVHVFRANAETACLSEKESLVDEDLLPGFSCDVSELFCD